MATTSVPTNTRVVKWERSFFREYIRANRFSKYMGSDESSPIQINEDLTKTIGEQINFELVNRLVGSGWCVRRLLDRFGRSMPNVRR